jgi:hypothetical protein
VSVAGKHGPINQFWFGWHTVKFDQDKEEPIRDAKGRCIICKGAAPLLSNTPQTLLQVMF